MTRSCSGRRVTVGSSIQPLVQQVTCLSPKAAASSGHVRNALSGPGHLSPPFRAALSLLDLLIRSTDRARGPASSAAGPVLPSPPCGSPQQPVSASPAKDGQAAWPSSRASPAESGAWGPGDVTDSRDGHPDDPHLLGAEGVCLVVPEQGLWRLSRHCTSV